MTSHDRECPKFPEEETIMNATTPDLATVKERMKATWGAGDFGEVAKSIESHAEDFMSRHDIGPGRHVLDIACGTGNLALPAARAGASVVGIDLAGNLVEQARERAKAEGLEIRFDEGDAEALPYADAGFDLCVSMYGIMFAPRPEVATTELLRVCRPGGTIALASWTPEGFIGRMLKVVSAHVPPPPGVSSPLLWGQAEAVRERLGDGVSALAMQRVPVWFDYPFPPADTVDFYRRYYGPILRAFDTLSDEHAEALEHDLVTLWSEHNTADDGTTRVEAEYLEVVATRA
jgi:ubiquinone/menaquinone biosynthesis C-methylase UbiE